MRRGKKGRILPVAEGLVEADDAVLLVGGEVAPLDVRAQVIDPPQSAALSASHQPCRNNNHEMRPPHSLVTGDPQKERDAELTSVLREGAPVGVAVLGDVVGEQLVLLGAPGPPLEPLLLTTRCPPHEPIQTN